MHHQAGRQRRRERIFGREPSMKAWISRAALQGTRVGFKTPFQQRWLSLAQQQDVGILELAGFKPSLGSGGFEVTIASHALVAQLDRASPSEGEGRRFESCRARHPFLKTIFSAKRLYSRGQAHF